MRTTRVDKNGLKQGAWTAEEDRKLTDYISKYRIWTWSFMAKYAGLSRSGKSCRLRWVNYLDPNIRRGNITKDEENIIIEMYAKLGSRGTLSARVVFDVLSTRCLMLNGLQGIIWRWSKIASRLPGRTDNEIKNYWHTHLKKLFKDEPKKSIEPPAIEIPKLEDNQENLYGINNIPTTPSASAAEASNSQETAYESLSSFTTFSRESDYNINQEIDQVGNYSSEPVGDFHSFWAQPFFTENAFMEYEQPVHVEDWYQQPLSPYGIFNNEFWFNDFGVVDGTEQPNFYYKGEF